MHALAAAVAVDCVTDTVTMTRAERGGEVVAALIEQACDLTDPADFQATARQVEQVLAPWRANRGDARLAAYVEQQRGVLYAYALRTFGEAGACLATKPTEPLTVAPSRTQAIQQRGPRSLFNL